MCGQDKLPDSSYKTLTDYHAATVTLLALNAAAIDEVKISGHHGRAHNLLVDFYYDFHCV